MTVTWIPEGNRSLRGQGYPTLVLRVRTRGTPVTLSSLAKSSVDKGGSYPSIVGLLDVTRAAPHRPTGNTKGMAGFGKSRFVEEKFLTCPSGPDVGTARHYTNVV